MVRGGEYSWGQFIGRNCGSFDDIYRFGMSSVGARPKAHIKENGTKWIVKFPCRINPINVGEREYLANKAT